MSNQRTKGQRQLADALGLLMLIVLSPLIVPILLFGLLFHLLAGLFLYVAAWFCWCARPLCVVRLFRQPDLA